MLELQDIPGIGKTFTTDFARIGISRIAQLKGKNPERLFSKLVEANAAEHHPTSKNYLYVIRMVVYFAEGGRDPELLRWNAWTDKAVQSRERQPGKTREAVRKPAPKGKR